MGSSMGKSSNGGDHYPRKRQGTDIANHFSKEYSEYWRRPSRKKLSETFAIQRNNFSTTSAIYAWPTCENRNSSQFVSSFSKSEKPAQFVSGFAPMNRKSK